MRFSPTLVEPSLWLVLNEFVYQEKKTTCKTALKSCNSKNCGCVATRVFKNMPPQHKMLLYRSKLLEMIFYWYCQNQNFTHPHTHVGTHTHTHTHTHTSSCHNLLDLVSCNDIIVCACLQYINVYIPTSFLQAYVRCSAWAAQCLLSTYLNVTINCEYLI